MNHKHANKEFSNNTSDHTQYNEKSVKRNRKSSDKMIFYFLMISNKQFVICIYTKDPVFAIKQMGLRPSVEIPSRGRGGSPECCVREAHV